MAKASGVADDGSYVVIHLVAHETLKDLIASQVVDHMQIQAELDGAHRPRAVFIVFLDAARTAMSKRVRARVRELRRRAPGVRILHVPVISRLPIEPQARLLARRLRQLAEGLPIVFHCRTETPVPWAITMADALPAAGIVLDVRGAWAEEFLFYRGFDGPEDADDKALQGSFHQLSNLQRGLERSTAVLSVSAGMLDWLRSLHVPERWLSYVPCCVVGLTYDPAQRAATRARLGFDAAIVFAYVGTITPYQHVPDGVAPFFLAALRECAEARLLCITDDPEGMRKTLAEAGVPLDAVVIDRRPQGEVADLLVAADCGLILRAPSRINQFSQPTKLGEYLAAGVPVIVATGTGRVGNILEEADAGMAVDVFGVPSDVLHAEARRVCDALRARHSALQRNALDLCQRAFQWSSYVPRVREAYLRALGRTPTTVDAHRPHDHTQSPAGVSS